MTTYLKYFSLDISILLIRPMFPFSVRIFRFWLIRQMSGTGISDWRNLNPSPGPIFPYRDFPPMQIQRRNAYRIEWLDFWSVEMFKKGKLGSRRNKIFSLFLTWSTKVFPFTCAYTVFYRINYFYIGRID